MRTLDITTCKNKFTKQDGLFGGAKWFCSEACADKDQDLKNFMAKSDNNNDSLEEELGGPETEYVIDLWMIDLTLLNLHSNNII